MLYLYASLLRHVPLQLAEMKWLKRIPISIVEFVHELYPNQSHSVKNALELIHQHDKTTDYSEEYIVGNKELNYY